ncbi:hypothetical protein [Brevibacterium sp.]|uniref:hypothetical protein n=1 Tax=Brevibacterium sp. TaxID=1701 RepID=UPI002812114F|nr:hypothetical protein [Brevibacterium sp.]
MSQFMQDVGAERLRQIEKGYTPEHDDEHGPQGLVELVDSKLMWARNAIMLRKNKPDDPEAAKARTYLVEATAMLVAAGQALDRESEDDDE